jgi:hypothetical protein
VATTPELPSHSSGFHSSTALRWSCTAMVAINTQNSAHASSQPTRLRPGRAEAAIAFIGAGIVRERHHDRRRIESHLP